METCFNAGSEIKITARGDVRKKYETGIKKHLLENELPFKEPIALFANWMDTALANPDLAEPNAMCLATSTSNGTPSARMVLLKSYDKNGFVFFTNYNSRKGKEMVENPNVAAVVYWEPLSRSVRIEGSVVRMSTEYSAEYFHSRPKNSQISAYVSDQSSVISGRDILDEEVKRVSELYSSEKIPHPTHWGGLRIIPAVIEFWEGRSDRLHDRIRFRKPRTNEVIDEKIVYSGTDGWVFERLAP